MISCHQSGLTRQLTFQTRYYHPDHALRSALDRVGIDPNINQARIEQRPLYVFEPVCKHGMVVIVRQLEEIGDKLKGVISIVNKPSPIMELFGITKVRIANTNGILASSFHPTAYRSQKISTIQEYYVERVRLVDDTADWYADRGQTHTHTKYPHVYERYTKGKGKGKANKGSRNFETQRDRAQHDQEEQKPSGSGPLYDNRTKPWISKAKSRNQRHTYEPKHDDEVQHLEEAKCGTCKRLLYAVESNSGTGLCKRCQHWKKTTEPQLHHDDWDYDQQDYQRGNSNRRRPLKRGEPSRTPIRRIHKDQWQAQNQSHSYATPTCKSCGEELKHAEAGKRSGNCNKCHHRSDDTPQTSSSAKPATTGSSRGGGNGGKGVTQVCIKCSNALSEEERYKGRKMCDPCSAHYHPQLGGLHRGDKEDSYWPGDSHHRGNTAPWKGQIGSK